MIQNLYFILKIPDQAIDSILKHTVEKSVDATRRSNDDKLAVVKLPIGAKIPASMQNLKAYTHSEILKQLSLPEWKQQDII